MKTILEKLYNGEINPSEQPFPANIPNYKQTGENRRNYEDKLSSKLNDEQNMLYENLYNENEEIDYVNSIQVFTSGFKLGARIILEVLQGEEGDKYGD